MALVISDRIKETKCSRYSLSIRGAVTGFETLPQTI